MARDRRSSGDVDLMISMIIGEMFTDDPPAKADPPPPKKPADGVKQASPRTRPT